MRGVTQSDDFVTLLRARVRVLIFSLNTRPPAAGPLEQIQPRGEFLRDAATPGRRGDRT